MVVAVKYLRGTHKPEAILLSLTPLVFERFLPSLTLWLSPNCLLLSKLSPALQTVSCRFVGVPKCSYATMKQRRLFLGELN